MERLAELLTPFIFVGPEGALIEGVKRIVGWDECEIEIEAGRRIVISGKKLAVGYKTNGSVLIKGRINEIRFEGRRE